MRGGGKALLAPEGGKALLPPLDPRLTIWGSNFLWGGGGARPPWPPLDPRLSFALCIFEDTLNAAVHVLVVVCCYRWVSCVMGWRQMEPAYMWYHPAYGLLGMIKELIITLGLIFQFVNTKESICFHMMFHIDLKYKISKLVGENIL